VAYVVITALLSVAVIGGLQLYFAKFVKNAYTMDQVVRSMNLLRRPKATRILGAAPAAPQDMPGMPRIQAIQGRGFLRVCVMKDRMPYAFENAQGQLVGFDVEMADDLAHVLGGGIEFVPSDPERMAGQIRSGDCDIAMSGIGVTPERASQMALSASYRDETLAFITRDSRRKEFLSRTSILSAKGLRLGIIGGEYYIKRIRESLPLAECIQLSSPREFFEGTHPDLDAFIYTAEAGSAWTLLYPHFAVVVPQPGLLSVPLAYATARGDQEFIDYINAWIELKKKDGTVSRLYDYWILGRGAVEKKPRWSILRDVLHWVK
jgi:ABC-type amino acid transport substrate-binding protein